MTPKIDPESLPAYPHLRHERALWANGILWVAGIDEAGRGALAGPVVVAAVILPQIPGLVKKLNGVRDSKAMTTAQRETWARVIRAVAVTYGVGEASAEEIDAYGIVPATQLASSRAIESLDVCPDYLLLDYLGLPAVSIPQISLVKGDVCSLSIAAASVIAKTVRDAKLEALDTCYPGYGLASHKGYGTVVHRNALKSLGPSPVHRKSFAPIRSELEGAVG